jgi:DNA-binding transcriptional LysR family regulator
MLNPRLLEIFRVVCETGSATSAATCLNTTQPNVTRAIGELEKFCAFKLFERGRFGMRLTPEGDSLLESVKRNYNGLVAVSRSIADIKGGVAGLLSAMALPMIVEGRLGELVARFAAATPAIGLKITSAPPDQVLNAVLSEQVDVGAIIGLPPVATDLDVIPIGQCAMMLILAANHPLTQLERIGFQDLDGQTFVQVAPPHHVRAMVDTMMANFGVRPRAVHEVTPQRAVASLVRHTGGVGFVDSYVARDFSPEAFELRTLEPQVVWPINLVSRRRGARSRACGLFLDWLAADLARNPDAVPERKAFTVRRSI